MIFYYHRKYLVELKLGMGLYDYIKSKKKGSPKTPPLRLYLNNYYIKFVTLTLL